MSRHTIGSMTVVRCDYPGCKGMFHTVSFAAMARKQAKSARWTRRRGKSIAHPENADWVVSAKTVDICPDHPIELPRPNKQPRKKKAA
jgi:hypothetical protein